MDLPWDGLREVHKVPPYHFLPTLQKSENPDYGPGSWSGPKTTLSEWEEPFNVLLGRLTAVWLTGTEAREPVKAESCGVDVDRELRAQDLDFWV